MEEIDTNADDEKIELINVNHSDELDLNIVEYIKNEIDEIETKIEVDKDKKRLLDRIEDLKNQISDTKQKTVKEVYLSLSEEQLMRIKK